MAYSQTDGLFVIQRLQADTHKWRVLEQDTNTANVELAHQAHYQDPADDTDDYEDVSKVPEDVVCVVGPGGGIGPLFLHPSVALC